MSPETVRLEVICAGWGRTGTLSLKTALDRLGYPCYHMSECFKHKGHAQRWMQLADAAADGHPVDFSQVLSGYTAVTDHPPVYFWKQLIQAYPDAKVILTVRNPNKWYESIKETVWEMSKAARDIPWYVSLAHKVLNPGYSIAMVDKLWWQGDLQGCFANNPEKAKLLFEQHNKEVGEFVPADRLLVYEVSQGWQPLCKFLGKPMTNVPFPHENERQQWKQMVGFVGNLNATLTYGIPVAAAGLAAAGVAVARWWLQRSRQ